MKQNPPSEKDPQEDFSVLSFSSAPNESIQFHNPNPQQPSRAQGYCLIIAFVVLGFYFIVFGIIELSTNFNEIKYRIQLKRNGSDYLSENTFVSFKQNTSVLVYLELQDLTQFDSGYGVDDGLKECREYTTNGQMKKYVSIVHTLLNPQDRAIPCGRHAFFYPEGNFEIISIDENTPVSISTNDISFLSNNPFPNSDINPSLQWASFENQRLKNWMTIDAQEKVKKLWGRITQGVSGNYQIKLTLNNQMPQVNRFFVSLANNQALSGYNTELCYLNFFYAVLTFIAALANFLIQVNFGFIQSKWGHRKVLKKKPLITGQGNQIKIYLNSAATTPAVKFE